MIKSTFAFPKERRLRQAAEFAVMFREGKKRRCPYFTLISKPNGLDYPRLGMVVAKRAVRLANTRNLIKRVIRESFRLQQPLIEQLDIVVVAHPEINRLDKIELRQHLDKQWARLKSSAAA